MKKKTLKTKSLVFDYKTLGNDILAKREKDNLTMAAVHKATKGKLKRSTVFNLECAKNTYITTDVLIAACNFLGKPVTAYIHN